MRWELFYFYFAELLLKAHEVISLSVLLHNFITCNLFAYAELPVNNFYSAQICIWKTAPPPAGSPSKWLEPDHVEAKSFIWVFHVGTGAQALGSSSTALPGALARSWLGSGGAGNHASVVCKTMIYPGVPQCWPLIFIWAKFVAVCLHLSVGSAYVKNLIRDFIGNLI